MKRFFVSSFWEGRVWKNSIEKNTFLRENEQSRRRQIGPILLPLFWRQGCQTRAPKRLLSDDFGWVVVVNRRSTTTRFHVFIIIFIIIFALLLVSQVIILSFSCLNVLFFFPSPFSSFESITALSTKLQIAIMKFPYLLLLCVIFVFFFLSICILPPPHKCTQTHSLFSPYTPPPFYPFFCPLFRSFYTVFFLSNALLFFCSRIIEMVSQLFCFCFVFTSYLFCIELFAFPFSPFYIS